MGLRLGMAFSSWLMCHESSYAMMAQSQ